MTMGRKKVDDKLTSDCSISPNEKIFDVNSYNRCFFTKKNTGY